jgi:hypothetical protein
MPRRTYLNNLRAYDFCGVTITSTRALPDLRRAVAAGAECSVAFVSEPLPAAPRQWFHQWRLRGGRVWLSIGRMPGGYVLRFPDQADFVVAADGTAVVVHPARDLPEDTLRHLLIDQVLPLALSRRGRFSLHASAVHLPGIGTVGFAGETGRGKSTLAAALAMRGGRLITDDCLAIDFVDGEPFAVPGYPGLRLWPGQTANTLLRAAPSRRVAHYSRKRRVDQRAVRFHGRPSPLRALFILSPRASAGAPLSIRRCRASAGLMGLLRYTYVLDVQDRQDLAGLFSGLAALAATVPVMRLRLRHGESRLPQAADLIREYVAVVTPPEAASAARTA